MNPTDADTEAGRGEGLEVYASCENEDCGDDSKFPLTDGDSMEPATCQCGTPYTIRLRQSDPGGDRDREYAEMIDQVLEGLDSLRRDQSLPVRVRLIAGQAWGIIAVDEAPAAPTDEAPEGEARAWFRATECNQPPIWVPHSEAAAHGAPVCPSCSSVTCMVRTSSPPVEEGEPKRKVWWCRDCGWTGDCVDLSDLANLRVSMEGAVRREPHEQDPTAYRFYITEKDAETVAKAHDALSGLRSTPQGEGDD